MVTAALDFFRHRLPVFRAPVAITGGGGDSLRGMAAVGNATQCFVLWSRVSAERETHQHCCIDHFKFKLNHCFLLG